MGLMGLAMACDKGVQGMLSGLTKSTDHPSNLPKAQLRQAFLISPYDDP